MKYSRSLSNEKQNPAPGSASPIVTLTTDFGLRDYFVGSMKGVLLERAPGIRLVDITHDIPRHDVVSAAFVIKEAYRYFPVGSIHLVVVDPGVGTERREIIAVQEGHFFVAPDNGLLTYLFQKGKTAVYQFKETSLLKLKESATFAGRDRFAPMAALLAKGVGPEELGAPIKDYQCLSELSPRKARTDLIGKIVYFDHFGNAITNLTGSFLRENHPEEEIHVFLRGKRFEGIKKTYAEGKKDAGNLILNSSDHLEIFVPGKSAKTLLKLKLLDELNLKHFFGTSHGAFGHISGRD